MKFDVYKINTANRSYDLLYEPLEINTLEELIEYTNTKENLGQYVVFSFGNDRDGFIVLSTTLAEYIHVLMSIELEKENNKNGDTSN